jgi:ribosome biogenesis GTPase A
MKKGFWLVVKETVRKADVVLEIIDARMPDTTRNEELEKNIKYYGKRLILVFNKADIVSQDTRNSIKKNYASVDHAIVSTKNGKGVGPLIKMIKSKSKKDNLRIAMIGYPNTGKSSLINRLSKKGRAKTSPESGFTKGIQLIAGKGGIMMFDTPGVVPYEDRKEVILGLSSAISPSKLEDPDIVAIELLKIFKENNPIALEKEYGLDTSLTPDELLSEFGKKRNMLLKGGIVDENRAAVQLLNEWHKGKIRL